MMTGHRRWRGLAALVLAALLGGTLPGCGSLPTGERGAITAHAGDEPDADRLVIVAVVDSPDPLPSAGGTPRGDYRQAAGYSGGARSAGVAASVARDHGLTPRAGWAIAALRLRCLLYRIADGAERGAVLAELARDPRVELAQPLNGFTTLAADYDDPYLDLQHGFRSLDAAGAQRWSRGKGVRIAVIDSAVDPTHPDLAGQLADQRDFIAGDVGEAARGELHGTEIAGVIAAVANNGIGIVGIAPDARLLAYRACRAAPPPAIGSRCDSFTLAKALGAAISADADIINLSLGGPDDPLLDRLVRHAMQGGAIVVGALPTSGRREGFPTGIDGVVAVGPGDDAPTASPTLRAPGRDILTLMPGGHYGYASGSSLAAAHVSGVLALLRSIDPGLRSPVAQAWLAHGDPNASQGVDACAAVRHLRPAARCASDSAGAGGGGLSRH